MVSEHSEDTWDGLWLCGCSDGHGGRLGLPFLILCHHVDVILCVPVQPPENHVLAAAGQPDFRFPLCRLHLKTEINTVRMTAANPDGFSFCCKIMMKEQKMFTSEI